MSNPATPDRNPHLIDMDAILGLLGFTCRSSVYYSIRNRGFPKALTRYKNKSYWKRSEVDAWRKANHI